MVGRVLENRVVVGGAGQVRIRKLTQNGARERRHRNLGSRGIDGAGPRIANVDGENALTLRRARQRGKDRGLGVLAEAFVIGEEERAVLHDWTSADATVLIPVERRLLAVRWF